MRVGFYECDVTPPLGGHLNGNASRDAVALDVKDRLYVKAAVFEQDGELAAMVGMDTCHVPDGIHDFVTKRVNEYTPIPADKIMITSNHTHTGAPVVSSAIVGTTADEAYKDVFFRLVADSVILAYKRLQNAEAKFGTALVDDVSYVRNYEIEDGSYVTHGKGRTDIVRPIGEIDPTLSVLMVESEGRQIGAIINFALHQDTVGQKAYSGDFSSIISKELKKIYGQDFVSLFLVGACGNINHVNPDENAPHKRQLEIGERLTSGVLEAVGSAKPVGEGILAIKDTLILKRRNPEPDEIRNEVISLATSNLMYRAKKVMFYNTTLTSDTDEVIVGGIKIGNTCLYFIPGEIFSNYSFDLKKLSPFENNIVIENSNSRVSYIPAEDIFGEKNKLYEAVLGSNCHEKEAGRKMIEKAAEIGKRLKN